MTAPTVATGVTDELMQAARSALEDAQEAVLTAAREDLGAAMNQFN